MLVLDVIIHAMTGKYHLDLSLSVARGALCIVPPLPAQETIAIWLL